MITSLTTTNDWITLETYLKQDSDIEFPAVIQATLINQTDSGESSIALIKSTKPLTTQAPIVDRGLKLGKNESVKGVFEVKNTWIKSFATDEHALLSMLFEQSLEFSTQNASA